MMTDQYGSFLIPVIMGKLLADVRLQIARVTTRAVWDVEEILQIESNEKGGRFTNIKTLMVTRRISLLRPQDYHQEILCLFEVVRQTIFLQVVNG